MSKLPASTPACKTTLTPFASALASPPPSEQKDTLLPYPNQLAKQRSSPTLGQAAASSHHAQPTAREELEEQRKPYWRRKETAISWAVAGALIASAAVLRFSGIGWPNSVVFDEVHFGKVRPSRPPGPPCSHPPADALLAGLTPFARPLFRIPPVRGLLHPARVLL